MPLDQEIEEFEEKDDKEMSFIEHVDELRKHLKRIILAVLIATIGVFCYIETLFHQVIVAPLRNDFFTYRVLCEFGQKYYHNNNLCVKPIQVSLQNTDMAGQFTLSFKLSFIAGLIVAMPYILWQLWLFIKPALNFKESKGLRGFVFYTFILFMLGILFGYFVLCPISINFLSNYTLSPTIKNEINIDSILGFISLLVLGTGLIFELPVLIYFLARIGLISSSFLKKYRKYAVVIILIIAAIVTPPDVISQVILTIPMYMLFEMGIVVAKRVEKKQT